MKPQNKRFHANSLKKTKRFSRKKWYILYKVKKKKIQILKFLGENVINLRNLKIQSPEQVRRVFNDRGDLKMDSPFFIVEKRLESGENDTTEFKVGFF